MNCKECKIKQKKQEEKKDNDNASVPFFVHEANMTRMDRHNKRLCVALIVLIIALFASNALWLWAWSSYDYTSEGYVYTQDGQGVNVIGDSNEVAYGAEVDNP